ncbi:APC family permease [Cryptosporangium sp. NPDC048952]|uniref:APC family permease n=1 Tax=Cryptosporangium sp. NPDC048952 TaxID=3363961 RepID=UPI0037200569
MAGKGPRLGRELSIWEAVGISVALMAPSMAANINPQGMVGSVSRAVPLTFALATAGVLLVAYTFVRLTQKFHHSGSVYGFVGATLGPRPGVVAGWGLLGTYLFYAVVTSTASARFLLAFLDGTGIWRGAPDWMVLPVVGVVLLGVLWLTISPVRLGTRVLLVVEAATVALILIVAVVVLVKVSANGDFSFEPFTVQKGTDSSALFLGVVFGFLSFAGFEAAATLGEETKQPRRDIPRAILGTAIFGGVYFVFVTWVEVMGFDSTGGMAAFEVSGSLFGDLGRTFVGAWLGDLISLGAAISAFGCALACAVGASRLLYAMARDGLAPPRLAHVDERRRTPVGAAIGVVAAAAVIEVLLWLIYDTSLDVFVAAGVIGTLVLLVVYVLASIGVIKLLFVNKDPTVRAWEVIIPVGGLIVLGYTLYRNVIPLPEGRSLVAPLVAAVWLLVGVVGVLAAPQLARRAGTALTTDEGLTKA